MAHLRPCSGCARHVRANVTECPFCEASLAIETTAPQEPQERIGRAARMAFGGAAAVVLTVSGCGKSARDPNENIAMPYGAPPMPRDAQAPPATSDGDRSNIMMPYGAPPTHAGDGAALIPNGSQPLAASDAGPDADAGKKKPVPTAVPTPTPAPTRTNINMPYGAPPADGYDVFDV